MIVNQSTSDCTDPWLGISSKCCPLNEHHYAEVHDVCSSFQTDDPPLWSGLPTTTAHAAALRENWGHCLNCHEDTRSLKQCRHPFINASGCLNPDLEQPGDDGEAYRRWQARITRYRREGKPSRSNNQKKTENKKPPRYSSGQHQRQGQQNIDKTTTTTRNKVTSSLGLVIMVESRPLPPVPLLPPPLESVTVPLTLAETRTHASQAPSAPSN